MSGGFRVRVSLERFFSDERARCLVWVRPDERPGALLARLRAQLGAGPWGRGGLCGRAGPRTALLARGHLLPPREPLRVLRDDDLVESSNTNGKRVLL